MRRAIKIAAILVATMFLLIWLMHQSISLYWQQAYHKDSPLSALDKNALWRLGAKINQQLTDSKEGWVEALAEFDHAMIDKFNRIIGKNDTEKTDESAVKQTQSKIDMTLQSGYSRKEDPFQLSDHFTHNELLATKTSPLASLQILAEGTEEIENDDILFDENSRFDDANSKNIDRNEFSCQFSEEVSRRPAYSLKIKTLKRVLAKKMAESLLELYSSKAITNARDWVFVSNNQLLFERFNRWLTLSKRERMLRITLDYTELPRYLGFQVRAHLPLVIQAGKPILSRGDRIFYVGDSLMQGVAPHVRRALYRDHGIEGIDLSKQSTGLTYKNYYNWSEVVKETLSRYSDIKLMVVYLGPNDPWDLSIAKGRPYVKFKSKEWEAAYRERIAELIKIAQDHGVRVLWLGVPSMKRKQLNDGMLYLNTLFKEEVTRHGEFYITTWDVLGSNDENFANFVKRGNRNFKVRANDGIHFTISGQKIIAEQILNMIHIAVEKNR